MLTRSEAIAARKREQEQAKEPDEKKPDIEQVDVRHSPINEQIILAAAAADDEARVSLCRQITTSANFLFEVHAAAWDGMLELTRKGLLFDLGTFQSVVTSEPAVALMKTLVQTRPNPLNQSNIEHHVDRLFWDRTRHTAATGPVSQLLEAIATPNEDPSKVQGLARAVSASFESYGNRSYILDSKQLAREAMAEMEAKQGGTVYHPVGIDGLDFDNGKRRIVSGCNPTGVTVITGVTGGAKSTVALRIIESQIGLKRRVVYGAWEQGGRESLAILAGFSLGLSRTRLEIGDITAEEKRALRDKMDEFAPYITFVENPFFGDRTRSLRKRTNDDNLDIVEDIIATKAPDLFVADLWKRCLRQTSPDEEELALIRQQDMTARYKIHSILVQQQRFKDVEMRPDKRPTREGIKGSGAWVEIADLILGTNRPAQWKRIPDDIFEIIILKQRRGVWPIAIEFDWNGEFGTITNGRTIEYDRPGETSDDLAMNGKRKGSKLLEKMNRR